MKRSESVINIFKALAQFQGEAKTPKNTNTNPMFRSKYASLGEIIETIKEPLSKNGLSVIQDEVIEDGYVSITTYLFHESGEFLESEPLRMPILDNKGPNALQTLGISITYGRRYQLSSFLGLSSMDDIDGNDEIQQNHNKPQNNKNQSKPQNNKQQQPKADTKADTKAEPKQDAKEEQKFMSQELKHKVYSIAKEKGFDNNKVNSAIFKKLGKTIADLTRDEFQRIYEGYANLETPEPKEESKNEIKEELKKELKNEIKEIKETI